MPDSVFLSTTVNGAVVKRDVRARTLLSDFLRDDLGLTGTKVSCDAQVCGTCTVLVDGLPVSACSFLAADTEGRAVTTIEGLADGDELSPVQRAFTECSAMQCGYCTPGFVLAAEALLGDVPNPSDAEIRHALDGNLCRCTGYRPIMEAVRLAARLRREAPRSDTHPSATPPATTEVPR
ncbi:MAG TPA: (2Fe-2S)-binding protein [Trebonia sp.]|nr:(2Fe-2S)-binding protein [Trebonia sp.]